MDERINMLEKEIEYLKTQALRLRLLVVCLFVTSMLPYLLASSSYFSQQVVRAERFELLRDGEVVAFITAPLKLAEGGLVIYDPKGKPIVGVVSTPLFNGLSVHNDEGKPGVTLIASPLTHSLGISNREGKTVATLSSSPFGGILSIGDNNSKTLVSLCALLDGGRLEIYNKDYETVASLYASPKSPYGGRLEIQNPKNKKTNAIVLTVAENGSGLVATSDAFGDLLWSSPLK